MDITFKAGNDFVVVKIINKTPFFMKMIQGIPHFQDISKINLSITGIIKQFPDLEGKPNNEIREEGFRRLKEHMKSLNTEEEVKDYIIKELEGIGCKWITITKQGFRPVFNKEALREMKNG